MQATLEIEILSLLIALVDSVAGPMILWRYVNILVLSSLTMKTIYYSKE